MAATATDPTEVGADPVESEAQVFGDFRLIAKLGEGGMGAVY